MLVCSCCFQRLNPHHHHQILQMPVLNQLLCCLKILTNIQIRVLLNEMESNLDYEDDKGSVMFCRPHVENFSWIVLQWLHFAPAQDLFERCCLDVALSHLDAWSRPQQSGHFHLSQPEHRDISSTVLQAFATKVPG